MGFGVGVLAVPAGAFPFVPGLGVGVAAPLPFCAGAVLPVTTSPPISLPETALPLEADGVTVAPFAVV